jgi:carboxymethylenebutenolidase
MQYAQLKILNQITTTKKSMNRRDLLLASTATLLATAIPQTVNAAPKGKIVQLDKDLRGYFVSPGKAAPAILVLMEAFGLNDNIKGVCDRLAASGYAALAPDFYHGQVFAYKDIQAAIAKLKTLDDQVVMAEFGKGLDFLKQQKDVSQKGVGVTGFCMGGRYTFLANSVHAAQIKAAVSFYGGGIAATADVAGRQSLLDRVKAMQAPIMFMYGSEDSYIMAEEHARIATALSQAKKRYAVNVFPGAGHGFMSDRRDSYNPAAATEAWEMTMAFFDRHLAKRKG